MKQKGSKKMNKQHIKVEGKVPPTRQKLQIN